MRRDALLSYALSKGIIDIDDIEDAVDEMK